jgi:sugar (pentulose or hexulose) kinase
MDELLGVLDIGKTHVRFFTTQVQSGRIVFEASNPTAPIQAGGIRQLDLHGIESWLFETLRAHPNRGDIRTLVPVAHGAAAVFIDRDGKVLVAPDYEDEKFESVRDEYRPLRDSFEVTFSPFLPYGLNLGRQVYYLETRTDYLARAHQLMLYPQYWAWRLSAVAASEVTSLGCHSDLWRPLQARNTELAVRRGWSALLPPLQSAGHCLGTLSSDAARETGLSQECRVLCGMHDSNASFFAHLALRPDRDFAVVSSGTWTIVMAPAASLNAVREPLDMLANVDVSGTPVATARFMGGREYEVIAGDAGRGAELAPSDLEVILAQRIFALPSFASAGGPFATIPGRMVGAEGLSARARATLATLYVALMTDYLLEHLGVHGDVLIDGPLTSNELYAHVLASFQPDRPVFLTHSSVPAATAAMALLQAHPPTIAQHYELVSPGTGCAALRNYRAAWLEAVMQNAHLQRHH